MDRRGYAAFEPRCAPAAVAARAGHCDLPGAGVLLVRRDCGGWGLLHAHHAGAAVSGQFDVGATRLSELSDQLNSGRHASLGRRGNHSRSSMPFASADACLTAWITVTPVLFGSEAREFGESM